MGVQFIQTASCRNLHRLKLRLTKDIDLSAFLQQISVKELDLSFSLSSSMRTLQRVLQCTPIVEALDFSFYNSALPKTHQYTQHLSLPAGSLTCLRRINFHQSFFSIPSIYSLLNASTCLDKIEGMFLSPQSSYELSPFKSNNIPQLKEVVGFNCSSALLGSLLMTAHSIQILHAYQFENVDYFFLPPDRLEHLKYLHLEANGCVVISSLKMILRTACNLEILILEGFQSVIGLLELPAGSLQNLKEIRLENCNLDKEFMKGLLEAAPEAQIPFKNQEINHTKNQDMIIEKLCQYWTLTNQNITIIHKTKAGICAVLSTYFCDISLERWDEFIHAAWSWDGERNTLSNRLSQYFYELSNQVFVQGVAINQRYFIGDRIETYIDEIDLRAAKNSSKRISCILENVVHVIAIRCQYYDEHPQWQIYEPNDDNGYQIISKNEVANAIRRSLGSYVCVLTSKPSQAPSIQNANNFLQHGGLIFLCQCKNTDALLPYLNAQQYQPLALRDGLLFKDTRGTPAWIHALREPDNKAIETYAHRLLMRFIKSYPNDYEEQLDKSISYLPLDEQANYHSIIQSIANKHVSNYAPTLFANAATSGEQNGCYEELKTDNIPPGLDGLGL